MQKREAVNMRSKLTDKKKKKIIADYVEIGSYSAVAKKHGVAPNTVRTLVLSNADIARKCNEKKEQNTADILAHMETKKEMVTQIIDAYLLKLLDPVIMERSTPSQLTTALGTLIDKFASINTHAAGTAREDDPLTKALKEEAERMNRGDLS
jgi:hypothetical protein